MTLQNPRGMTLQGPPWGYLSPLQCLKASLSLTPLNVRFTDLSLHLSVTYVPLVTLLMLRCPCVALSPPVLGSGDLFLCCCGSGDAVTQEGASLGPHPSALLVGAKQEPL